ncbi:uncharacterized protein BDCG_17978 [Blastomyces dermatitidis ER-3]|uniref:Uncharacterized protein n=1 Tax=Ajellomyces dermatitidis (strain ER-3 / ATCC MYA-2586) TaxID=559297 RepID=A0ABX2W1E0_AJEDR|nr:uncharacterized protein BDCG_17978 [Blastomyces dermatitidis ER-3]OAT03202.1 hypothetical protein BDCG_17978 [Blastomyces dermatitidis ER-3]
MMIMISACALDTPTLHFLGLVFGRNPEAIMQSSFASSWNPVSARGTIRASVLTLFPRFIHELQNFITMLRLSKHL